MIDFKEVISEKLGNNIDVLKNDEIKSLIEVPPNKEMGDYAFPCFKLAKEYRKSPMAIAEELSKSIPTGEVISKVINVGGYVNFFVNKEALAKKVITQVLSEKKDYGKSNIGEGKNVLIDF